MGLATLIQERSKRERRLTITLLAVALCVHLFAPRPDPQRKLAKKKLGAVEKVDVQGAAVFRAGKGAMLFFDVRGSQGPIRGAVIVHDEEIEEVVLLFSREGLDRSALESRRFLDAFRNKPALRTVVVDVVSGATVSSRLFIRAVNRQLQRWRVLRSGGVTRGAKRDR